MLFDKLLAFIDVETSGGKAQRDRIIEIGIIISDGYKIVEEYSTLIQPGVAISSFIQNYTGISDADVADAPRFEEVADKIYELLEGKIFVAHNVHFDYGFLRHELRRAGYDFSARKMCTVRLSRQLYPEYKKHNLDIIMERSGLDCANRHRALDDTRLMYQFFQICIASFGKPTVIKVCNTLMLQPSIPINISQDVLDSLPETHGVYQLYGKENALLHLARSNDIRKRVLSHFSEVVPTSKWYKISQELQRIEVMPTAGDLGALLLESELNIEKKHKEMVLLKKVLNTDGYPEIHIEQGIVVQEELSSLYGVFRTKAQAKDVLEALGKEYHLSYAMLGLQVHCDAGFFKKKSVQQYALQFEAAFAHLKIQKWSFNGVLMLRERCDFLDKESIHLFYDWKYLGTVTQEFEIPEIMQNISQLSFDYHVYRILRSYLKKYSKTLRYQVIPYVM